MTRKRRVEISGLNVLFCITVIFIHIISYAVVAFQPNTFQYNLVMIPWRLSSFVVQGFIMLAGVKLFLNSKDSLPFPKYIKSRLRGVILPYAVCFAVYYLYFMVTSDYPLDIKFMAKHFLLGSLVFHLYFIPIIFQFDLLFPLWKRIVNKCSPIIVIPFAIFVSLIFGNYLPQMISSIFPNFSFIYNDRFFTTYLMYWIIGCYIGKNYDSFCDILKSNFRTICITFGISLVLVIYFSYLAYNNIVPVPYLNDIHSMYVIFTCIFLYAVFLKIPARVYEKIPFLARLDRSSLYIYLYHVLALFLIEKIFRVLF